MCQAQTASKNPPVKKVKAWLAKVCEHFGVENCVFEATVRLQAQLATPKSLSMAEKAAFFNAQPLPTQFIMCLRIMIKYIDDFMAVTTICKAVGEIRSETEWARLEFSVCTAVDWDFRAACNPVVEENVENDGVMIAKSNSEAENQPLTSLQNESAAPSLPANVPLESRSMRQPLASTSFTSNQCNQQTEEQVVSSFFSLIQEDKKEDRPHITNRKMDDSAYICGWQECSGAIEGPSARRMTPSRKIISQITNASLFVSCNRIRAAFLHRHLHQVVRTHLNLAGCM